MKLGTLLGFIALVACDSPAEPSAGAPDLSSSVVQQNTTPPEPPQQPTLRYDGPKYPAAVLYILYREYIHKYPGLTSLSPEDPKYQQYIERRLRQLYPARGHSGMMREAAEQHRQNRMAWLEYERAMREYERKYSSTGQGPVQPMTIEPAESCADTSITCADPSWSGQEEFAVPDDSSIPTIQMEIDSLALDPAEIEEIYYYESLATGTYLTEPIDGGGGGGSGGSGGGGGGGGGGTEIVSAGEVQFPTGNEVTPQVVPEIILTTVMGLGIAGYKYFRAKQAARRAVAKTAEFFPSLTGNDDQADAFRHIYLSVMLRRYLGKTVTKAVTDDHESNSFGATHVMDLHNNDIGRTHRYEQFRNHWFHDRWDWREWATRVRDYINYPAGNGVYIPEWKSGPTTEQAWQREASVPDARYIYFKP